MIMEGVPALMSIDKTSLSSKFLAILLLVGSLLPATAIAFETDQYNLPPVQLADIGNEVSEYLEGRLRSAIAGVNGEIATLDDEIARRFACTADKRKGCKAVRELESRISYLRSEAAVVEAVFKALGSGTSTRSDIGRWFAAKKFAKQPDRFKPSYGESIYKLNLADYLTQSPTINMWGVDLGFDKIEHFLQEGHKYYKIAEGSRLRGRSGKEAVRAAINWGQLSERTFYGLLVSGVYSQADLAANYAGMKFYERLTRRTRIGDREYMPLLTVRDGVWAYDAASLRETLLRPFISDHLNEALNPSSFRLTLVRSIRRNVRKFACPDWRTRYADLRREELMRRSGSLTTWNGEDYGHVVKSRTVTIGDMCFRSD
jgi:uncharacterized small protein (DUF1192 family)